jgi:hypothetical protein
MGWTKNNDSELTKRVIANSAAMPNLKVRRSEIRGQRSEVRDQKFLDSDPKLLTSDF